MLLEIGKQNYGKDDAVPNEYTYDQLVTSEQHLPASRSTNTALRFWQKEPVRFQRLIEVMQRPQTHISEDQ